MYSYFIQFTIPKIGQALVALVLYANFLTLPFVGLLRATPLLYLGVPLALLWLLSYISRDPLGSGMIFAGHLTAFYVLYDLLWGLALLAERQGAAGAVRVWRIAMLGGLLPWAATAALMLWGRHRAKTLYTTTYRLTTPKALPNGGLRLVQLSDIHPGPTMNHTRLDELRARIDACRPDLIVLTGDIYDEYTARAEFDAFNDFFASLHPPLGKWFVYGNHDLGHHWREPSYDRAALESAFAKAGVRVLEDVAVTVPCGPQGPALRIVGRKDWLYAEHRRFAAAELLPSGPDDCYTIWLDHEPRELKDAAAAGADVILCGHTHGGQIWPTGLLARIFRYNEINYGCRAITPSCAAVVSGGTGTWGYRIRTEGRTEVVCVEITQEAPEVRGLPVNGCLG